MVFRGSFHSSKQLYPRQAPHAERTGTNKGLAEDENPSDAGSQYANPLDEYCHFCGQSLHGYVSTQRPIRRAWIGLQGSRQVWFRPPSTRTDGCLRIPYRRGQKRTRVCRRREQYLLYSLSARNHAVAGKRTCSSKFVAPRVPRGKEMRV
jgi:hypothetical protein